jgi:hypothetical protein
VSRLGWDGGTVSLALAPKKIVQVTHATSWADSANAALVRSLIRRASSSATVARMCNVKRSPQPSLHRSLVGAGCCEP